jgi:type I restriction enzyme S subunit
MDLATFFEHFDTLAEAPNGIQRLRELILDMAVRGKLVPQDPADEPAEKLIKGIQAERKNLIQIKKLKAPKKYPILAAEDIAFPAPTNWKWARFGDVTICRDGERIPLSQDSRQSRQGDYDYYGASGVIDKIDDFLFDKPLLLIGEDGANLINRSTPIAFIATGKYWVNNHAHILDGMSYDYLRYLEIFVNSIDLKPYITGTAQPKMNQAKMNSIPVPLPPLAEQKRIVAKVDELMGLCDTLEAAQQTRNTLRLRLRASALDAMMTAPSDDALSTAWAFVRDNWDTMSDRPEDVEGLRQSVLQTAFRGALRTQSADDGSVCELISCLDIERRKLVKSGKMKGLRKLPDIDPDEVPFSLPSTWLWIRLGNLAETITKGSSPKWQGVNYVESGEGIRFITSENVRSLHLDTEKSKYVEKIFNEIEPRSILRKNDLLINIVGASIGRAAIFDLDEVANINQAVCLLRLISSIPLIDHLFVLYFLNSPLCVSFMFDKQVDNARANLSMGNLAKFLIPLPPLSPSKNASSPRSMN